MWMITDGNNNGLLHLIFSANIKIALHFEKFMSINRDGFVRSSKMSFSVIPVKTGIQEIQEVPDSRLRRSDDCGDFLRVHQT
jgi:hypothetical protein